MFTSNRSVVFILWLLYVRTQSRKDVSKRLPLEGGRSARKTVQWTVFSEGRAAAPEAVRRGAKKDQRVKANSRLTVAEGVAKRSEVMLAFVQVSCLHSSKSPHPSRAKLLDFSLNLDSARPTFPSRGRLLDIPFTLYSVISFPPFPTQSSPPPRSSPHPRWFPSRRRGWRCPWRRTAAGRWCRVYWGRSQ